MRKLLAFALALGPCGLALGGWACSGDTSSAVAGDDASADDSSITLGDVHTEFVKMGAPDASFACQISPSGPPGPGDPDPVLLCSQQAVLGYVLTYAYKKGQGVMSTWSSSPPYAAGSGHQWQDDVGLAAAIGDFHCGSNAYGNNITTMSFDQTLPDLAGVLTRELSPVPLDDDGAIYYRLRSASLAYSYTNDDVTASALNVIAEAYARAIQTSYTGTATIPAAVDGGVPEAGNPDGAAADGSGEAGVDEAGPTDGGSGGGTMITLIGKPGAGGTVAYEPAKSVMAAAALLDLARLHASDADAGTDVATWRATALGTIAYVWSRGRDPVTGLFYKSLITSSDPGHDALAMVSPANDALLTDVQGPVVLGLARAYSAAVALQGPDSGIGPVPNYPAWGDAIVASMNAAPLALFDGVQSLGDGGNVMNAPPAPPGAFFEGYVPSTGATMTNKTVAGNALLFAGFARTGSVVASPLTYENNGLRWAFSQTVPYVPHHIGYATTPWPARSNLFSAVVDSTGQNVQQAFLRATSKGWGLAQVFPASGLDAGLEPGATDYRTDANLAFVEALTQLWTVFPNAPACVY